MMVEICPEKREYECPCGRCFDHYYDGDFRLVRDLPFGVWDVYLYFFQVRVECPECGVKTERVTWLDPGQRHTKRFAAHVAGLCRIASVSAVAERLDLNWKTAKRFDKQALEAELDPPDLKGLRILAVNEIAIKKGHKYATVILDFETRRVVWAVEDRTEEALCKFYEILGKSDCAKIEAVDNFPGLKMGESDDVILRMLTNYTEVWVSGLLGAAIMACVMASDSQILALCALFTRNLYVHYLNPRAQDRELLWIGRTSGLFLTLSGVIFALTADRVLDAFLFTETIAAFMGVMFLGGILWRRANRYGAWAATLSTFGVYYTLNYLANQELKLVYKWQAVPFAWAMLTGFAALILISLLTRPEPPNKVESFFENMRRTTDEEDLPANTPRPLAADRGEDLVLLDLPGWFTRERWIGFPGRYREDMIGFALAWLAVAALILLAWVVGWIGG